MIAFERVGVTFTGGYQALNDLSIHVPRGEFAYILGNSGAGKSTLLRLTYADLIPTRGIVRIAGNDISFLPTKRVPYLRRQVGVVFQDFMLLNNRTVFDNIRMALDIYYFKKSDTRERIWNLLKRLGIFELRDSLVKSLSGGEKQRVAVARAMVNDPQIILADEPTGNLDKDNANIIMQMLFQAKAAGATVLMATHDTNMVAMYPAREIHLERGRLLFDTGSAADE
jgi:cell division transport system ATP-binding protein